MKAHLLLLLLPLLISCEYDEDFEFVPETQAGYFLMQENSGTHSLHRLDANGNIQYNWGQSLGLDNPTDIAGDGENLWIALANRGELVQIQMETEEIQERFELGDFMPHFISMGNDKLLLGDTSKLSIGFFDLKKHNLSSLEVDQKPQKAVYRSTKFYQILGDNEVGILSEVSFSFIERISFERRVVDVLTDNRFSTWVFSQDQETYLSKISWNTNALNQEAEINEARKVRHSPYLRADFGKEYTLAVGLIEDRLSLTPNPLADDFEVDFFEAQAYFTRTDSLYKLDLFSREQESLGVLSGSFKRVYFFQSI